MNCEQKLKMSIQPGDIMALDTTIAAFVIVVEGSTKGFTDPAHGARINFRWLAHPDTTKETKQDWIWESTLQEAAWHKIA